MSVWNHFFLVQIDLTFSDHQTLAPKAITRWTQCLLISTEATHIGVPDMYLRELCF